MPEVTVFSKDDAELMKSTSEKKENLNINRKINIDMFDYE